MNKILNPKESVFKPMENKSRKKANEVFIKLLVKNIKNLRILLTKLGATLHLK